MKKDFKIGFVGFGNMGSAIVKGIINNEFIAPKNIYIYDINTTKVEDFASKTGANSVKDVKKVIEEVDVILMAVKPNIIKDALLDMRDSILEKQPILVSIAAGTTIGSIYSIFNTEKPMKIIRVMPNFNAMVGEGAAAVCGNEFASEEDIAFVITMFNSIGKAWELAETHFSNFTALAGSSPAYTFLFIDSIARAGVKNGLSKEMSLEIATQAVLGSAKTLELHKENPWTLIDKVSSPGGTTVAGLIELENNSFISTVVKGIDATFLKDLEIMSQFK